MAEKPIEIPITLGGVAGIRKEIKALKSELINATDPAEIERLSKRAGDLTERMRDANEQVSIFAGGSGFEKLSNNLGDIGSKILSLDFKGANDSAKLLTKTLGSLSPQEIGSQIKGLVGVVGNMGKAFIQFGIQLLTNPIFLLVAVITAIVVAVGVFLNKIGVLQKVLDFLFYPIKKLIEAFNWLTDAIGLTDNAGDEYAKNETERLDKLTAKNKEFGATKTRLLENEIRLQKASGKDTERLEREKQQQIIATAKVEFDLLTSKLNNRAITKRLSEDELKDLKKSFSEAKVNLQQAKVDLNVFNAEQQKERADDQKKLAEDNAKKNEKYKQDRDARIKAKQEEKNRLLQIERERLLNLKMLENQLLDEVEVAQNEYYMSQLTAQERELQAVDEKYFNLIERAKQNNIDTATLEEAKLNALNDINVNYAQQEAEVNAEKQKKIDEDNEAFAEKELARKKQLANASLDVTKSGLQGISDLIGAFAGKSKAQQKKAFEAQKKLNIAISTIDTIKGGISAFTGMISTIPGPIGIALGVVAAAGVVASGVANIAKISKTKFDDGNTSGASGSAPTASAGSAGSGGATPAQPSFKLFGQANQGNNVGETQNATGNPSMVLKATVSETEVTRTQKNVSKFEQLASL